LIDLIVKICISNNYPVLLGVTMKHFIQHDYPIPKKSFQHFVLYLEKCKGYEEDAKKFVFMTSETETLDFSYDLVRPLFQRNMELKSGNDVLQLFEQIRKNIKLNRTAKSLSPAEKAVKLQEKRKDFYDGLLKDLLAKKAYALAQIVYGEKMREKFEPSVGDQLIGLEIFGSQRKIEDFSELFNKLLAEAPTNPTPAKQAAAGEASAVVAEPEQGKLTQDTCEQIAKNLMYFDSDKEKNRRLEMAERLFRRVIDANISLSARLFDSLIFVFTESQQWRQLIDTLNAVSPRNCTPEVKTLNYLKKNLLYCFEPQLRSQLKEQIESLEDTFFAT